MAGAVIIVVILVLVLPVLIILSGALVAAALGYVLDSASAVDHTGTELGELNK